MQSQNWKLREKKYFVHGWRKIVRRARDMRHSEMKILESHASYGRQSHLIGEMLRTARGNKTNLIIRYIGAILRFIVKRISGKITLCEMRLSPRVRFYPFFLYLAGNMGDRKSRGEREKRAKGILDPWLLTFRKSLSSIISRGSCFPDVAGKLRQTSTVYTHRTCSLSPCARVCVYVCVWSVRVNSPSWLCAFIRRSYNTKLHIMWRAQACLHVTKYLTRRILACRFLWYLINFACEMFHCVFTKCIAKQVRIIDNVILHLKHSSFFRGRISHFLFYECFSRLTLSYPDVLFVSKHS